MIPSVIDIVLLNQNLLLNYEIFKKNTFNTYIYSFRDFMVYTFTT